MAKEFKTLEELIELMESRGIVTDENTRSQLSRESYYVVLCRSCLAIPTIP